MAEAERLNLIREIEKKRGSRVISYITSDRTGLPGPILEEDVRVIEHHLRAIMAGNPKKVDLFIHSPGGRGATPWSLVSLIREFLGPRPFGVLIPSRVYSAGAMISIGADEIVMGPAGNIGPIDAHFGSSLYFIENITGYFDLADQQGLTSRQERLQVFTLLAQSLPPLAVGLMNRYRTEGERTAMLLLKHRRRPLSDKTNREIAHHLLYKVGDHGQAIRRTEARSMGISYVRDAEDFGIDATMSDLFAQYEALMQLDVPHLGSYGYDGESIEMPVAIVESVERLDIAHVMMGQRFWVGESQDAAPAKAPAAKNAPASADVTSALLEAFGDRAGAFQPGPKLDVKWQSLRGPQKG